MMNTLAQNINVASPDTQTDLTLAGRVSRCTHCGSERPSDWTLPFFKFAGEGSRDAGEVCQCGYGKRAHEPLMMANNVAYNRRTVVERGLCSGFVPRGAKTTDEHYCGCSGWD